MQASLVCSGNAKSQLTQGLDETVLKQFEALGPMRRGRRNCQPHSYPPNEHDVATEMPDSGPRFEERLLSAYVSFGSLPMEEPMTFSIDARHSGRNAYAAPHDSSWPREFLTLAIVSGLVVFWALALLATGAI